MMDIHPWEKCSSIFTVIGVIAAIVFEVISIGFSGSITNEDQVVVVSNTPLLVETPVSVKQISESTQNAIFEKIKNDIMLIQDYTEYPQMQTPFDSKIFTNDQITHCEKKNPHDKCPILNNSKTETGSQYAFVFPFPNQNIPGLDLVTSQNCEIKIMVIDSIDPNKVKNKWDHREWCTSSYSVLMTSQYAPRGVEYINVNSLLVKYTDSDNIKFGIVTSL